MLRKIGAFFESMPKKMERAFKYKAKQAGKHKMDKPQTEAMKVRHLQEELTDIIDQNAPADFINFFDQDLITDPVLAEAGETYHLYDRASIEQWLETNPTSPLTRQALTKHDLIDAPEIKRLIDFFADLQARTLNAVAEIKSLQDEEQARNQIDEYIRQTRVYSEQLTIAKETPQIIQSIKNRFFLDKHNVKHLQYWSEEKRCLNLGLERIDCKSQRFYLSESVYNVLMAADRNYKHVSDFRRGVDAAKSEAIGCWPSFWGTTDKARMLLQKDLSGHQPVNRLR